MARLLVICNLHYEKRVYRGFDENLAWGWLLGVVDYHGPDYLLGCGDRGTAVNEAEFYRLLEKTIVLTIYGNHENTDVLARLYNVRSSSPLPVLMEDGRVYELAGLRVAGINGIVAKARRVRKGVPRKKPEEYLAAAERLVGQRVDLLLIHETSYLPHLFSFMVESVGARTALKAVEMVKPRIVVNEHMHAGRYKTHMSPWSTLYIYIDSSQQHSHYLVMEVVNGVVEGLEVWIVYQRVPGLTGYLHRR